VGLVQLPPWKKEEKIKEFTNSLDDFVIERRLPFNSKSAIISDANPQSISSPILVAL
jgi:hypothetical protein